MNLILEKSKIILIFPLLVLAAIFPAQLLAQEETTFSLVPSIGNYNLGEDFSLELKINSSPPITSIKSYLNFDKSALNVKSIDTSSSLFPYWWENVFDNKEGEIKLQASLPAPGFTGSDGLIARINFQALKEGAAHITYDPSSLVLKPNNDNVLNLTTSLGAELSILPSATKSKSESKTILDIVVGALFILVILFLTQRKRLIKAIKVK